MGRSGAWTKSRGGIATAALTLQSVLLQALVAKGALSHGEVLEITDKCLAAARSDPRDDDEAEVAEVTFARLEHVRGGLVGMADRA